MSDTMPSSVRRTIILAPLALVGAFSIVLAIPATRDAAIWLLLENHPVEIATFLFLLPAGFASLYLAAATRRRRGSLLTQGFYLLFGAGLIFTGMEEIAWGQYWLGFESPAALVDLNVKGEATLHNIAGLNERTEILRVLYGLGGLVGTWLHHRGRLQAITPPSVLWTWFAVIAAISTYDLANDITPLIGPLDTLAQYLDELVEMLIGLSALLFVSMRIHEARAATPTPESHPA